ncbi:hypothetical protein SAMN05216327_104143 [Dyadobacter sp. SG02]|nr:hypothetical protein SAMN05216327_104143 [Dyadobacter sp. SG02]
MFTILVWCARSSFFEEGVLVPFEVLQFLAFKQYQGEDISQPPFDEMHFRREEEVEFNLFKKKNVLPNNR